MLEPIDARRLEPRCDSHVAVVRHRALASRRAHALPHAMRAGGI